MIRYAIPHAVSEALAEDVITEIRLDNRTFCLLRRGDLLHAFAANCPHAGAALCEGFVDARGLVVCPAHGYRFDPRNGYNKSGEGYKLRMYNVEKTEDGGVAVLLPDV